MLLSSANLQHAASPGGDDPIRAISAMSVKAAEIAYAHGLSEDAVIKRIRDGDLAGYSDGDNWFVGQNLGTAPSRSSDYHNARSLAGFLFVAGWVVGVVGVLAVVLSLLTAASLVGAVELGFGGIVSGLLVGAVGGILKATAATAEHTKSILALLRSKQ
jgi:hypothetical protein